MHVYENCVTKRKIMRMCATLLCKQDVIFYFKFKLCDGEQAVVVSNKKKEWNGY